MRKYLSIVIPRYKETEEEIFPLLSSINGQAGIDFSDIEVIIANDGKETIPLNKDFLSLFHFDIKQITCKVNRGCGPARQAGFDIAKGDYLMCCDADDILHSVGVLGALLKEAAQNSPDMITSPWLEEVADPEGHCYYITHENDNTWMHGKLYRRYFLIQNEIRFPDFLRIQEDSYFNGLAASFAEKKSYVPVTSYVWKYNPDSTTRKNGGIYAYESIPDFIRSCSMVHKIIEKKNPEQMEYKILQFTLYHFFRFHQPSMTDDKHKEYLAKGELSFVENIKPFWHYWQNAEIHKIAKIYNQERTRNFSNYIENETIWEWIKRLGLQS